MKASWLPYPVSFNVTEVKKMHEFAEQAFEAAKKIGWKRPHENKGYTDTPQVWFDMIRSELAVSRFVNGTWAPTIGKADRGYDVRHGTTTIQVRFNQYDYGDFYDPKENLLCDVGVLVTPWAIPKAHPTDVAIVGFLSRGDFVEKRREKQYVKGIKNWAVEQHELQPVNKLRAHLKQLAKDEQRTML